MSSGDLDQSTVTSDLSEAGSAVATVLVDVLSAAFSEVFPVLAELSAATATVSSILSVSATFYCIFTFISTDLYSGISPAGTQIFPLFPATVT